MVGRRGKEGGIVTQCDMVNLQKSSQGSRGLSVLVARGKEMLDRQSNWQDVAYEETGSVIKGIFAYDFFPNPY